MLTPFFSPLASPLSSPRLSPRLSPQVNFLMEDVVVFMSEDSLAAYASFIVERASYAVTVTSPSVVLRDPLACLRWFFSVLVPCSRPWTNRCG